MPIRRAQTEQRMFAELAGPRVPLIAVRAPASGPRRSKRLASLTVPHRASRRLAVRDRAAVNRASHYANSAPIFTLLAMLPLPPQSPARSNNER
jgi:hypothetical protein